MLKATVLSKNLKTAVSFSSHGVSSRSQLPILLNFLLETKDGSLFISSTDLEVGVIARIPAKVEGEGQITIPAKTFSDLISNIEQEKIEIEEKEKILTLSGAGILASFPTLSASEFPKLFEDKGQKLGSFPKKDFDAEIGKVAFASAADAGRPALSGVLIKKEEGEKNLTIVATDGFRLSLEKNLPLDIKTTEQSSLLIPSRVIREILTTKSEEGDDKIEIYASSKNNQVVFEYGQFTVVGRLIEAEYPQYEKIIPDDFSTKATFDRLLAQSAVRACSVFAREAANIIKMSVLKDKVKFSASASSVGENEIELEAKVDGEENEIAFNARYLIELFSNIESEQIEFEMSGPLNAGVFRIPGDKNYLHLIMPIRVQE